MEDNTSTRIEQFLKPKAVSSRKLARDAEGRLLMAEESALDMDRIRDAGMTVRELGRRVRLYNTDMTKQIASYVVALEVIRMSERPQRCGPKFTLRITRDPAERIVDLEPGAIQVNQRHSDPDGSRIGGQCLPPRCSPRVHSGPSGSPIP